MATVYRGYVTLNGRTTLELEVSKNHHGTRPKRWALIRTSNHSRDCFRTARGAMEYGSRLNHRIEWKRETSE
jgi:hypothetical protein